MKLLDRLIVLNKLLEAHTSIGMDINSDIQTNLEMFANSSRLFKDNQSFKVALDTLHKIQEQKQQFDSAAQQAISDINSTIRKAELKMIQRDYHNYYNIPVDIEVVAQRMQVNEDFFEHINNIVGMYSDWRWAGVDLNPGHGKFTSSMLACDPFYIYNDTTKTDMDKVKQQFNEFFVSRRLMEYTDISQLPQNNIGLAINLCEFEFMPMDPIRDKLKMVYDLLMPGGHFLFTYNDCEYNVSLEQCAYNYRSYNTKTLMESAAYSLGYNIIDSNCIRNIDSYMVIKKTW